VKLLGRVLAHRPVHSTGVWGRIGARMAFRLSTARGITYTVVAAAALSSLIWNQG
jgi:hypothetical protein